jgi:hypothetical protein
MVLARVKLKKCELFFLGYFGESELGDLKIQSKIYTSIQF